jgi:hypothetical protein
MSLNQQANIHHSMEREMGITSAGKRVDFVSDGMSYIILRGHWYDIILNVNAPTEDKINDIKDRFYEELEHVLPKYHMKILLGGFTAKVGREDIFKPTAGNENWSSKLCHIQKSHIVTFINLLGHPDGKTHN